MNELEVTEGFDLGELPSGEISRRRVRLAASGLGESICVPVLVLKGTRPGPVLGLTAALHGNELNGMRVIHEVVRAVEPSALCGTLIAVPVANVPGYLNNRREFNDGADLNRLMPGKPDGTGAQIYAHRLMERVVSHFQYLVDLHTASFGRVNSLYVRADLTHPEAAWMARAQNPQILLHNCSVDGTLRSAAMQRGIPAITVEVGNPQRFQQRLIDDGYRGVVNVMARLGMISTRIETSRIEPLLCIRSGWTYTDVGGVLEVFPELVARVRTGELIAQVSNVFGDVVASYRAPHDAVVIGKSDNPVNQTGSRIVHLGIEGSPDDLTECPI